MWQVITCTSGISGIKGKFKNFHAWKSAFKNHLADTIRYIT